MSDEHAATGTSGEPALWVRTVEGAEPDIGRRPFLYRDSGYAAATGAAYGEQPQRADRVNGPMLQPPVWTWEIPLYFWLGGIAAGSSFVAFACDLAGDHRSARVARRVAVGAIVPCPPLLISDLGRPGRFHHMLRVFRPRSPMNMGAWALTLFGGIGSAAVAADLAGRERAARRLGAANAVVGGYVGSYTGVLLATTAVPLWSRSRLLLGPIFVSTAVATGAAVVRFAIGADADAATRRTLGWIEAGAITAELTLSTVNERSLGDVARPMKEGNAGHLFQAAKWGVRAGLGLGLVRRERARRAASALFLASGLAFRHAWIEAGKRSARDDETVAQTARGQTL